MQYSLMPVLTCALLLTHAAGPAQAASNTAKNRCADAVQILRSPKPIFKTKDIDATQVNAAIAHWNQVSENWRRANDQMKQVPRAELVKGDPDLRDCFNAMADYQDYVKLLKKKLDAAQAEGATLGPFLAAVQPYTASFSILAGVHFEPTADVFANHDVAQVKKRMAELASVETICSEKMPDAGNVAPSTDIVHTPGEAKGYGVHLPDGFERKADNWCWVAKNRTALLATAVGNRPLDVEGYGNFGIAVDEFQKHYAPDHPDVEAWLSVVIVNPADFLDKTDKAQAKWCKDLGLPAPTAKKSAALQPSIAAMKQKVDEVAPQVERPSGKEHAAALEAGAAKTLKGIYPGAKVVLSFMDAAGWTLVKTRLGVPKERYRSGQIVFSVPGSKWCQQRAFSTTEAWTGGESFAPSAGVNVLGRTRFLACK